MQNNNQITPNRWMRRLSLQPEHHNFYTKRYKSKRAKHYGKMSLQARLSARKQDK